jgi:hypothetical protein
LHRKEEREAPQGSAPSARKKFAAKLLSAAKDGSLEKSLKDFESEAGFDAQDVHNLLRSKF